LHARKARPEPRGNCDETPHALARDGGFEQPIDFRLIGCPNLGIDYWATQTFPLHEVSLLLSDARRHHTHQQRAHAFQALDAGDALRAVLLDLLALLDRFVAVISFSLIRLTSTSLPWGYTRGSSTADELGSAA
jgi:hypothetical protein